MQQDEIDLAEKLQNLTNLENAYKNLSREEFDKLLQETIDKYYWQEGVTEYVEKFRANLEEREAKPQEAMRETRLEDLTDEQLATICTHSTHHNNLFMDHLQNRQGIAVEGLEARRGDWEVPEDDKENPRVFFCQGIESVLIRMNFTDKQAFLKSLRTKGELPQGAEISDELLERTSDQKRQLYKQYYDSLKEGGVVLKLDIVDTIDPNALDPAKVVAGKDYPHDILHKVYRRIANVDQSINVDLDNMKQNKWDMSTKPHESIPIDKISVLSIGGSTSALDIFKYFCEKMQATEQGKALYNEMEVLSYIDEREKQKTEPQTIMEAIKNSLKSVAEQFDKTSGEIKNLILQSMGMQQSKTSSKTPATENRSHLTE